MLEERLVSLVYLVCLVCLLELDRPDRPNEPATAGGARAYLVLIKTGFDWALPPPATMMMNDIPAFASGTMASIVESLMNLKATGRFETALKVTV